MSTDSSNVILDPRENFPRKIQVMFFSVQSVRFHCKITTGDCYIFSAFYFLCTGCFNSHTAFYKQDILREIMKSTTKCIYMLA